MGTTNDSGAQGSDAGFENTEKSKLSKKNQKFVDSPFDERGKLKLKDQLKKAPLVVRPFGPLLGAGSKVNRNFFVDKVLGSKNYKGTSKEDFLNMTVSQQEQIYGSYMKGRQTGKTDAYGNPTRDRDDGGSTNQAMLASAPAETQTDEIIYQTASKPEEKARETEQERLLKIKRGKRTRTRLTQDDTQATLGKKVLLG
jgi:hypothetical protein